MTELKEWPLSLLAATMFFSGALITLPIAIGCLFEPGWGWFTITVELAWLAKQANDIYQEERKLAKERTE